MKIISSILLWGICVSLGSCVQNKNVKEISEDTETNVKEEKSVISEETRIFQNEDTLDSLRLDKILKDALAIANQNIDKSSFVKEYEVFSDSILVSVEINKDYYFNIKIPHLIIKREDIGRVYIDIYSNSKNSYEKVLSHEQWAMTYVKDTIRDINGDGLNDFVVNWYGSSGCCLKAFSDVYLQRHDKRSFSEEFEFINPTFLAQEKIVRGVCYGHPGDTEMYKYKWIGEKIDTLEYVSFQKNEKNEKTGKVIISSDRFYGDENKIVKILDSVPEEYRKIDGYDWFMGNW